MKRRVRRSAFHRLLWFIFTVLPWLAMGCGPQLRPRRNPGPPRRPVLRLGGGARPVGPALVSLTAYVQRVDGGRKATSFAPRKLMAVAATMPTKLVRYTAGGRSQPAQRISRCITPTRAPMPTAHTATNSV